MSLCVRAAIGILSFIYRFMNLLFIQICQYIRLCNVELLDRGRGNGKDRGDGPSLIKDAIRPVTFEEGGNYERPKIRKVFLPPELRTEHLSIES
jgi:hypothetical protein